MSATVEQSLEAGRRHAQSLPPLIPAQAARAGTLLAAAMKAQQAATTQDDAA